MLHLGLTILVHNQLNICWTYKHKIICFTLQNHLKIGFNSCLIEILKFYIYTECNYKIGASKMPKKMYSKVNNCNIIKPVTANGSVTFRHSWNWKLEYNLTFVHIFPPSYSLRNWHPNRHAAHCVHGRAVLAFYACINL